MLKRGKNPESPIASSNTDSKISIIGEGTEIKGEITSNDNIRLDGILKGNLTTKGRLVIRPNGSILGDVHCKEAQISGKLNGNIHVEEQLELTQTANVKGDVVTSKLKVEPGAIFNGTCSMNQDAAASSAPMPSSNARRSAQTKTTA